MPVSLLQLSIEQVFLLQGYKLLTHFKCPALLQEKPGKKLKAPAPSSQVLQPSCAAVAAPSRSERYELRTAAAGRTLLSSRKRTPSPDPSNDASGPQSDPDSGDDGPALMPAAKRTSLRDAAQAPAPPAAAETQYAPAFHAHTSLAVPPPAANQEPISGAAAGWPKAASSLNASPACKVVILEVAIANTATAAALRTPLSGSRATLDEAKTSDAPPQTSSLWPSILNKPNNGQQAGTYAAQGSHAVALTTSAGAVAARTRAPDPSALHQSTSACHPSRSGPAPVLQLRSSTPPAPAPTTPTAQPAATPAALTQLPNSAANTPQAPHAGGPARGTDCGLESCLRAVPAAVPTMSVGMRTEAPSEPLPTCGQDDAPRVQRMAVSKALSMVSSLLELTSEEEAAVFEMQQDFTDKERQAFLGSTYLTLCSTYIDNNKKALRVIVNKMIMARV